MSNGENRPGLGPDALGRGSIKSSIAPAWRIPMVAKHMVRNPETNRMEHTEKSKEALVEHMKTAKRPEDYVEQGMTPQEANLAAMKNLEWHYSEGDSILNQQGRFQDPAFIEAMKQAVNENYVNEIPMQSKTDFLDFEMSVKEKNERPFGEMDLVKLVKGKLQEDPNDPFDKKRMDFMTKEMEAREGGYIGHKKSEFDKMMEGMDDIFGGERPSGSARDRLNQLKQQRGNQSFSDKFANKKKNFNK